MYAIEEDGTTRDLQFDLQSAVTRVAEVSHMNAMRYMTTLRGKKREIGHELYTCFDENNKNYRAIFFLAPARKSRDNDNLESNFPQLWRNYITQESLKLQMKLRSKTYTPHFSQFFKKKVEPKIDENEEFVANYAGLKIAYESRKNRRNIADFRRSR